MDFAINLSEWLNIIIILVTFIISIIRREKKDLFPIQLYIIASLVNNVILKIYDFVPNNYPYFKITSVATNIYSLIEISLLYFFLYKIIRSKRFRILMIIFYLIYFSICFLRWVLNNEIFRATPSLFGIENIFLTIACLFYIYEIIKSDNYLDFKTDSKFLVTCGMLFYFSITTPFFFSITHLALKGLFYIIILFNMMFYILLYISFMKAYLCSIPTHKN
jgi:hypothetical protein